MRRPSPFVPCALLALLLICASFRPLPDGLATLRRWVPAAVVDDEAVQAYGLDSCFQIRLIDEALFKRIYGKSYKQGCSIPRSSLRCLHVLHRNTDGQPQLGELICNAAIADDLLDIFRHLYEAGYKIERITLIDDYDADDERSMAANNTSCFNFRLVAGSKKLSKHAQGLAVDINPLYNPCLHLGTGKVEPANGKRYAIDRNKLAGTPVPIITPKDLCHRLFTEHGFHWGGTWMSKKDYQHFEK